MYDSPQKPPTQMTVLERIEHINEILHQRISAIEAAAAKEIAAINKEKHRLLQRVAHLESVLRTAAVLPGSCATAPAASALSQYTQAPGAIIPDNASTLRG